MTSKLDGISGSSSANLANNEKLANRMNEPPSCVGLELPRKTSEPLASRDQPSATSASKRLGPRSSLVLQVGGQPTVITNDASLSRAHFRVGQPLLASGHQLVPLAELQRASQLRGPSSLRRQVMLATCEPLAKAHIQLCEPVGLSPIGSSGSRQVELTSGAIGGPAQLSSDGGAAKSSNGVAVPPRRPAHKPSRYATLTGRYRTFNSPSGKSAPNRYAHWAEMHPSGQPEGQWATRGFEGSPLEGAGRGASERNQQTNKFQHHFSAASRVLVVNPMQIVNLSEHTKSKLIKFIEAIKRFSEKWFSHILLLLFLAIYACLGAYVFISFEANNEIWEKQLISETRLKIINETWTEARDKDRETFLAEFEIKVDEYERLLNRACVSGMNSKSLENQWTFWGALFYSMTVFTTIGYGHLVPITFAGRVATMVYAIFGIPILLMVLADLGKLLTRIIKSAFKNSRNLYYKFINKKSSIRTRKMISDNTSQYLGAARGAFERGFAYIQPSDVGGKFFAIKLSKSTKSEKKLREDELDGKITSKALNASDQEAPRKGSSQSSGSTDKKNQSMQNHTHVHSHSSHSHSQQHTAFGHPRRAYSPGSHHHPAKRKSSMSSSNSASNKLASSPLPKMSAKDGVSRSTSSAVVSAGSQGATGVDQLAPQSATSQPNLTSTGSSQSEQVCPVTDNEKLVSIPKPVELATSQADEPETGEGKLEVGGAKSPDAHTSASFSGQGETLIDVEPGDDDGNDGEDEEDLEDELDIPVSFALFLLVTYMMFGAVVFSIWEGWNFFDSLYFVFISMSTIGFGDLVPQQPKRMIGTFIYLLFGLALTSMCINVVQEKIHASFLRAKMQIGEKMGFDLDQIMADDYYHDGSYGGLSECGDIDEDSTSVAISHSNSLVATQTMNLDGSSSPPDQVTSSGIEPISNNQQQSLSIDGADLDSGSQALLSPLKQSKSGSSMRVKKRGLMSLGSHERASMFRKSRYKKSFKAQNSAPASANQPSSPTQTQGPPMTSPTAPSNQASSQSVDGSQSVGKQEPKAPSTEGTADKVGVELPIAQVEPPTPATPISELIRLPSIRQTQASSHLLPSIVGLKQDCSKPAISQQCKPLVVSTSCPSPQQAHSITTGMELSARQIMEEASRFKLANSNRQLRPLGATRSQSMKFNPHSSSNSSSGREETRSAFGKATSDYPSNSGYLSAGSSRRASLNQELSQLDDIISALGGQSQLERYRPLLGIPTSGSQGGSSHRSLSVRAHSSSPSPRRSIGSSGSPQPNPKTIHDQVHPQQKLMRS